MAEYAPDASKLAWYTQSLARIDEVLNVVNAQGKYWYETDALGSTYAMTNAAGAVVSRSSYDVFGERSLASAYDVGQPFGFTGREQDPSGLVYARARYLSPATGRWDRPDPRRFVDGLNLYGYVRGMPTDGIDPLGLETEVIVWDPVASTDHLASLPGHASVRVNQTSYSWETDGITGHIGPWDKYLERQQEYRSGTGYVFNTTPAQDATIEAFLTGSNAHYLANNLVVFNVYNLITRNCGQVARDALLEAGVPASGFVLLPSNLHFVLRDGAASIRVYENKSASMSWGRWVQLAVQDFYFQAYDWLGIP